MIRTSNVFVRKTLCNLLLPSVIELRGRSRASSALSSAHGWVGVLGARATRS